MLEWSIRRLRNGVSDFVAKDYLRGGNFSMGIWSIALRKQGLSELISLERAFHTNVVSN